MSTAASNGEDPDVLSVHENAQNLLLALYNADDHRASTSDLKRPTDLTAANISGRHAKTLIREGWAEKVDTEDVGARNDANVYELTHRGKREAKRLLKEKPLPMSDEDRLVAIRKLQDEVRELKQEGGQSSSSSSDDRLDEILDRLDDHESRLDSHDARLDKMKKWIKRAMSNVEDAVDKINEVERSVK